MTSDYDPLSGDLAHTFTYTECSPEQATQVQDAFVDELERLATEGPTEEELAREVAQFERQFLEPTAALGAMDVMSHDILFGSTPLYPADVLERRRAVTPASAAAGVATMRRTALLAAGPRTDAEPKTVGAAKPVRPPAGYRPIGDWSEGELPGREYRPAGFHLPGRGPKERLTLGHEGATVRLGPSEILTVRYADAVACEHLADDARRLHGPDGISVTIVSGHWRDGAEAIADLDRRVDARLVACTEHSAGEPWVRWIESGP